MTGPELRAQAYAKEVATPCGLCGDSMRDKQHKTLLDADNIADKGMAKTLAQHQREEHKGQQLIAQMGHHNSHLQKGFKVCPTCLT